MTIPDAAIEAAAEHIGHDDFCEGTSRNDVCTCGLDERARAAIQAAEPHFREAIAQEIEGYDISDKSVTLEWDKGMQTAARIVRGGTP